MILIIYYLVCSTADVVICLSDFNIDLFNVCSPLKPCSNSYDFPQIINDPTRITDTSSTLIDPVFITSTNIVEFFGTFLLMVYQII